MSARGGKRFKWKWLRRCVQVALLALFAAPVLAAGWGLFGRVEGGDAAMAVPGDQVFSGTLSSSTVGGPDGVVLLDPFAALQVAAASWAFSPDWLLFALPVLAVYALVRARAFCGWVCPVNLLLEGVDFLRGKLGIQVREAPVPRRAKMWVALGVVLLSAAVGFPVFEAVSPISAVNKGIVLGGMTGLITLAAIVAAELFWARRAWCRSLCPLGGFYEALGRVGLVNVRIDHGACIGCDACRRACLADPGILEPALSEDDVLVRSGDCMACGACVDACPTGALAFGIGRGRAAGGGAAAGGPEGSSAAEGPSL